MTPRALLDLGPIRLASPEDAATFEYVDAAWSLIEGAEDAFDVRSELVGLTEAFLLKRLRLRAKLELRAFEAERQEAVLRILRETAPVPTPRGEAAA